MTETLREWVDSILNPRDPIELPPLQATVHGIGTDVEHDLLPLWALTVASHPRAVLELGTRAAISTRTLSHACQQTGAVLATCDPDPGCAPFLRGVPAVAFRTTSEMLYKMKLFPPGSIDVLFVDTDPHSEEQTRGHLDTWVAHIVRPGGLSIFHDINARDVGGAPRPDIQVKQAITRWLDGLVDFEYVELGHADAGGLGIVRRRT